MGLTEFSQVQVPIVRAITLCHSTSHQTFKINHLNQQILLFMLRRDQVLKWLPHSSEGSHQIWSSAQKLQCCMRWLRRRDYPQRMFHCGQQDIVAPVSSLTEEMKCGWNYRS